MFRVETALVSNPSRLSENGDFSYPFTLARDKLVILRESGELVVAEASTRFRFAAMGCASTIGNPSPSRIRSTASASPFLNGKLI